MRFALTMEFIRRAISSRSVAMRRRYEHDLHNDRCWVAYLKYDPSKYLLIWESDFVVER